MHFPSDYIWRIHHPPSYVSRKGLIYSADAPMVLTDLPSDSIDMVVTDPQYGISYRTTVRVSSGGKRTEIGGEGISILNDTPARASHLFSVLVHEAERVLKPGGCICCFAPVAFQTKNKPMNIYQLTQYMKLKESE